MREVFNSISAKRADFSFIALSTLLFVLGCQLFAFFALIKEAHAIVASVPYQLHSFKPADYFSLQGQFFLLPMATLCLFG